MTRLFVHFGKSCYVGAGFSRSVGACKLQDSTNFDISAWTKHVVWLAGKSANNNVHVVLWSISSCLCPSVWQLDHCVNAWCPWFVCPLSDVKTTCDACECTGCIASTRCDHKSLIRIVVWAVAKTATICHDVFRVSSWLACCDWDSSLQF